MATPKQSNLLTENLSHALPQEAQQQVISTTTEENEQTATEGLLQDRPASSINSYFQSQQFHQATQDLSSREQQKQVQISLDESEALQHPQGQLTILPVDGIGTACTRAQVELPLGHTHLQEEGQGTSANMQSENIGKVYINGSTAFSYIHVNSFAIIQILLVNVSHIIQKLWQGRT